jgi:hypothetical protein
MDLSGFTISGPGWSAANGLPGGDQGLLIFMLKSCRTAAFLVLASGLEPPTY